MDTYDHVCLHSMQKHKTRTSKTEHTLLSPVNCSWGNSSSIFPGPSGTSMITVRARARETAPVGWSRKASWRWWSCMHSGGQDAEEEGDRDACPGRGSSKRGGVKGHFTGPDQEPVQQEVAQHPQRQDRAGQEGGPGHQKAGFPPCVTTCQPTADHRGATGPLFIYSGLTA